MEYTKPMLMLVGEVGTVVLGIMPDGPGEDGADTTVGGVLLGLDD